MLEYISVGLLFSPTFFLKCVFKKKREKGHAKYLGFWSCYLGFFHRTFVFFSFFQEKTLMRSRLVFFRERERESVCLFARGVLFSSKRREEEEDC